MALIGHQAPGFTDFHPNPFLMSETFGVVFQHVGLTEYIATALDTVTQQEVDADVEHVTNNLKFPFKSRESGFGVEAGELGAASRHYLAMKRLVTDNNFDALAIRCWPELPGPAGLGQWPYMALARLATEGLPVACEGDVDGSLGCLVGDTHLELGASPLCRWASCWGAALCTSPTGWSTTAPPSPSGTAAWRPPSSARPWAPASGPASPGTSTTGWRAAWTPPSGSGSRSPCSGQPSLRTPQQRDPAAVLRRFWVMENRYQLVVFEGRTLAPKRHLLGNNGLVEVSPPLDLVDSFAR